MHQGKFQPDLRQEKLCQGSDSFPKQWPWEMVEESPSMETLKLSLRKPWTTQPKLTLLWGEGWTRALQRPSQPWISGKSLGRGSRYQSKTRGTSHHLLNLSSPTAPLINTAQGHQCRTAPGCRKGTNFPTPRWFFGIFFFFLGLLKICSLKLHYVSRTTLSSSSTSLSSQLCPW